METTRAPKTVVTLWARNCPPLSGPNAEISGSVKIELTTYPDRCKVVVTGQQSSRTTRSVTFSISGYNYPSPPQWLLSFIMENSPTSLKGVNNAN